MPVMNRRLQVMIDGDRERRLAAEAERRGVSVATIVREAIDRALPVTDEQRREAIERILAAEPMEVGSVEDLRAEIDSGRRTPG